MFKLTRYLRSTIPLPSCRHSSSQAIVPRVAVVGAGPAGFYATHNIIKTRSDVLVDIFDKLPVPFGLVRFGVAPDHPEVKNCINHFTKTAENPRVRYIGNAALGQDFSLASLRDKYHAVLLTYGAEEDKLLGVPGEDLDNVLAGRSVVSLYNGYPGYQDLKINLDTDTAMVLGIGNVAIDLARMILTPVDILRKTDCTEAWLDQLTRSRVKRVVLVGRRGPLQVSFTVAELRELVKLPGSRPVMDRGDYVGVKELIPQIPRNRKRLTELLVKTAMEEADKKIKENWRKADKEWQLKLLRSPLRFEGEGSVARVVLGKNRIIGGGLGDKVEATGEEEVVDCGLVLRSIGYKSVRADPDLPFDARRGIVPNEDSRVVGSPGLYVSGWLATGPRGVIADTQASAFLAGGVVANDLSKLCQAPRAGWEEVVCSSRTTSWQDWVNIDFFEQQQAGDRPRVKVTEVEKMLELIEEL